MSASISSILDGQLFIGNLESAESPNVLTAYGITKVMSVCHEIPTSDYFVAVEDSEYADILIHLSGLCDFIEDALEQGERVLVHCEMGVSRSPTTVAAYLMRRKGISAAEALAVIRKKRPEARPNYGFLKQLDVFAACQFDPTPANPTYNSWKHSHKQHMNAYLGYLTDTIPIIPDHLFLSSVFPDDARQAECILAELGITRLLTTTPSEVPPLPPNVSRTHVSVAADDLLQHLSETCRLLDDALNKNQPILVHSSNECRACIVVCAYLMQSRNIGPQEAISVLEDAIPLFYATANLIRHLELFNHPSRSHTPLEHAKHRDFHLSMSKASLSAGLLGDTKVDIEAFADAMKGLHIKHAGKLNVKPGCCNGDERKVQEVGAG